MNSKYGETANHEELYEFLKGPQRQKNGGGPEEINLNSLESYEDYVERTKFNPLRQSLLDLS